MRGRSKVRDVDHLGQLRRELDLFAGYLDGDLSAPVEHCGDWDLRDLAGHLGRENLWAAAAVTEGHGDYEAPPAPTDPAELAAWFRGTSEDLLAALGTDQDRPAWTLWPPCTTRFWRRRRCMETLVHRWDAEHALGIRSEIDPALAADGVAEVLDSMAPRQVALARLAAPAYGVRLAADDTADRWQWGPGDPVATAHAPSADLLLMLWQRIPPSDLRWSGDHEAALALLSGPLVP
ncbi:MAG: hypothetical protein QOD41_3050 [Cryptosporangiaceae bacterium]|nr:hypothetical protein [Cryptosporangiaceae bacterium]